MWEIDESQTLLLVTRWVHHAPKTRERNLRSLLTWVQWPRLTSQAAVQLIQTHPLYTSPNSLLSLFFLLDALNEHSLLPTDFLGPFSVLKDRFCQVGYYLIIINILWLYAYFHLLLKEQD